MIGRSIQNRSYKFNYRQVGLRKQQSYLKFVNKFRVTQVSKYESFMYSFVCRANQGCDISVDKL